ncbi:MAG: response regulator [Planctomycetota bacterium]
MTELNATILVVDDDPVVRENLAAFLEDLDCTVGQAENGRRAVEILSSQTPDLVLLDLRMPVMTGLEVLAVVSRRYPELPVIVVSGTGNLGEAVEAVRHGAWDYLIKPIHDMSILEHAVTKALERARLLAENRRYREHLEEEVRNRTAELETLNLALERKNLALEELMQNIQAERNKTGHDIRTNVHRFILPLLNNLKVGMNVRQQAQVEQIERSLEDITSPFVDALTERFARLSPSEIRICELIRRGLGSKEIAEIENLSPETVSTHRKNIRRKLEINGKKVNLVTYLNGVMDHDEEDDLATLTGTDRPTRR